MQPRRPIEELPASHLRLPQGFVFNGIDENGIEFELRFQNLRRRVSSSGMVKAQIRSMTRGRPLTQSDLYEEEATLTLFVSRKARLDIRINPNMSYSIGRHTERTLPEIVSAGLRQFTPRSAPPGP
jgi:hypothetical protein